MSRFVNPRPALRLNSDDRSFNMTVGGLCSALTARECRFTCTFRVVHGWLHRDDLVAVHPSKNFSVAVGPTYFDLLCN